MEYEEAKQDAIDALGKVYRSIKEDCAKEAREIIGEDEDLLEAIQSYAGEYKTYSLDIELCCVACSLYADGETAAEAMHRADGLGMGGNGLSRAHLAIWIETLVGQAVLTLRRKQLDT